MIERKKINIYNFEEAEGSFAAQLGKAASQLNFG